LEGQELAARHIALREQAGLTQQQEAKMAGVSPTTISGIESGKITRPHLKTLLKIARALGADVGELREPGKAEVPPSPTQPALNGFEEERREDRRTAGARDAIEFAQRFTRLYENLNAFRDRMDEYRETWEKRLAAGDFDEAAFKEAGRAIRAFWPAVVTAVEAEMAEMNRIGMQPEEIEEHSILLPAMNRFQVLSDRVNSIYREMSKDAHASNLYAFPHREAS
jgi:transcriptional regulator with XRE-family HTH domain